MNLQQEWQNMSSEIASKESSTALTGDFSKDKSNSLLGNLLFKLKWKLKWLRIIDIPVLILALMATGHLQLLLLFFFLTYEICRWLMIGQLNKIKAVVDYSLSTKQVLEENLAALTQILKVENLFGYVFLPITGPLGLLAAKLYHHQTLENVLKLPNLPVQLLIAAVIGIPLIFLSKKANNFLFASHITDLKAKINALSN